MAVNRYRPRRHRNWGDTFGGTVDAFVVGMRFLRPILKGGLILGLLFGIGYGGWQATLNSPYFL